METPFTSRDVAAARGCTADTATRVAKQHGLGLMVGGVRIYSRDEFDRLVALIRDPGCPLFTTGNSFASQGGTAKAAKAGKTRRRKRKTG